MSARLHVCVLVLASALGRFSGVSPEEIQCEKLKVECGVQSTTAGIGQHEG